MPTTLALVCTALAATASAKKTASQPTDRALILRGGGLSLPQAVLTATGSAVSVSGIASLVDPKWLDSSSRRAVNDRRASSRGKSAKDDDSPVQEDKGPLAKQMRAVFGSKVPRADRIFGSVMLIGWGFVKLCVARARGPILHSFCRVNMIPMAFALLVQAKTGARIMPLKAQAFLATLYAGVGLGITKIPKIGDRFPDQFLDHLPGKLYLA